jgi:hypothetical protein
VILRHRIKILVSLGGLRAPQLLSRGLKSHEWFATLSKAAHWVPGFGHTFFYFWDWHGCRYDLAISRSAPKWLIIAIGNA